MSIDADYESETRVAVFARPPVLGRVKTRLAASIGDEAALSCYRELLNVALSAVRGFHAEVWLEEPCESVEFLEGLPYRIQPSGDIGARMLAAFRDGVKVLIGSDIPSVNAEYIGHAIAQLADSDLVLGPTEDGGYCLIGMNRPHERVFNNVLWSSPSVLESTLRQAHGLKVRLLDTLWDVDSVDDYKRWLREKPASWRPEKDSNPRPAP